MKVFVHRQRKPAHFKMWKMLRNHILWLQSNTIKQQQKRTPSSSGDSLQRLCKRRKIKMKAWSVRKAMEERFLHCRIDEHSENGTCWKMVAMKAGYEMLRASHRKVTVFIAVIYHRDRVCIKSAKTKGLWGKVHEKPGANCRCSRQLGHRDALNSPRSDAWGITSPGVHLSLWVSGLLLRICL